MYAFYEQIEENNGKKLKFKRTLSLAGIHSGLIPKLLKSTLQKDHDAPFGWHLPVSKIHASNKESIIIDIKPSNKKYNDIFLCELTDVYGYSYANWSPILLRLQGLFVDVPADSIDKKCFEYPIKQETLYTMLYLSGSVLNGEFIGTWNYPGPSSTNSVLLWPQALSYFIKSIKGADPQFVLGE